jgi:hypothetical protein
MDLGTFPKVGAHDPGCVRDGAALHRRGFVREIGRQMFATFGAPLPAPRAEMFVRTGTLVDLARRWRRR